MKHRMRQFPTGRALLFFSRFFLASSLLLPLATIAAIIAGVAEHLGVYIVIAIVINVICSNSVHAIYHGVSRELLREIYHHRLPSAPWSGICYQAYYVSDSHDSPSYNPKLLAAIGGGYHLLILHDGEWYLVSIDAGDYSAVRAVQKIQSHFRVTINEIRAHSSFATHMTLPNVSAFDV